MADTEDAQYLGQWPRGMIVIMFAMLVGVMGMIRLGVAGRGTRGRGRGGTRVGGMIPIRCMIVVVAVIMLVIMAR